MRMPESTVDATNGVIWQRLLALFFPLWFGTLFQQLYNTVDTMVVGRFVGKQALAAVGCTATIISLTVGIFAGVASGAVVIIARYFGAKRDDFVRTEVHTAMLLSLIIGAVFTLLGYAAAPWLLRLMDTTPDTIADATLYLQVYFLGMIPNVVYNMGTGVLRAVGDTKKPLYFLIAASVCNIVLDLLLVVGLDMRVLGAALATVISQLLSAVLVVACLLRAKGEPYQLAPRELRINRASLQHILAMGVPAALQSMTYSCSNILIQAVINSFGTDTVAAWSAYSKIDVLFWLFMNSMGLAVTTYVSQNYGAGKFDRLKEGVRLSIKLSMGFTAILSVFMLLLARPLLSIFITEQVVLDIGLDIMRFLVPCYITYVLVEILAGAMRGAGKALVPTLITVFGVCGLRLLWVFAAVPAHCTMMMVILSYPITWVVTSLALTIYYFKGRWLAYNADF